MPPSRIAASLKAARERAGWSRETLAHHSGVSWSAIAQIEAGRRTEVRLPTLSALADALSVSVDYLVGNSVLTRRLLSHQVVLYGSEEEFLETIVPFIGEGLQASESVLVVTTRKHIGLLRGALPHRGEGVQFTDSMKWYQSPLAAFAGYLAFVNEKFEAGAPWIRIVGEPTWAGRSPSEITAWTRYESILNLAFAPCPATIACPYDTRSLPATVLAGARCTHPEVVAGTHVAPSSSYREPMDFLVESPAT